MDISNEEQVRSVLQKFKPDIIINTAAITDGGVYDLEIISSCGAVERVVEGNFYLE